MISSFRGARQREPQMCDCTSGNLALIISGFRVHRFAMPRNDGYISNRLRHPAEEAADQAGRPPERRLCRLVLDDAALVEIFQELDIVRLGDGEILLADKHRVVVEERPDKG